MQQISFATAEDVLCIMALMNVAVSAATPKDWYVTDDEDFVRRHIDGEGYTLKYIIDGELAAFLIVRHPGEAEDNLGRELLNISAESVHMCATENLSVTTKATMQEFLHRVAHMESAAVHPNYRGKGLQGKLLQRAEEIEASRGTRFLMATVHPDNVYSLRNLEIAGYKCILETEKYGGLRRKVLCKEL